MTTLASISTQVVEPVNGCNRRDICDFQLPISKSKSCCPSLSVPGSEALGEALTEARLFGKGSEDWPNTYFHPAGVRTYVSVNQYLRSNDLLSVVPFSQSFAVTTAVSPQTRTVWTSSSFRS